MKTKIRLIIMNFLVFAVWGSYLTSMGSYLAEVGMGPQIGWFYSVQGFVSLFMPALIGIIADKFIPAQKMLSICHFVAAAFMAIAGWQGMKYGSEVSFGQLFPWYALSVAFFMPTIALDNSVSYNALTKAGLDTVKDFPPIRVFGTVGFICSMWLVDLLGFQHDYRQFLVCAAWSVVLGFYALTLPNCPVNKEKRGEKQSIIDMLGLRAFSLFKDRKMCIFFIFSMFLGVSLQITNGYANTFISAFAGIPSYAGTFAVKHANILISLSQISETLCILLIPFFLSRLGIKKVMLIAMLAWVLRFGFFAVGNPGDGVWLFILSMIVYGVAFDFFNISGSLFVEQNTTESIRSSAQGVFMMMTNGFGATVGTLSAQAVVNKLVYSQPAGEPQIQAWSTTWYIFAAYALVVAVLFAIIFKYKHVRTTK
ncbi:MAG: MFS transporter [Bacteroidaceae bacterium]|nr:MFS transporter [Bacteroidaceae bacterium]